MLFRSVDKRACVAAVDSTPMEHGDFLRITASSSTPMAVKDIILNSISISSLPYTEDAAWTSKCDDLVLDGFCLEVATSATCANYLCPTCAFANMCDFSCGFCDSRRGAATKHVIYVRTSDFANLATFTSGAVTVKMQGHPVLMPAALSQTSSDLVSYTARATDSCAGRCGGTAPSGCECNPTCKSRGTCCADAGHCCAVGTPSTGSLNVRDRKSVV